MLANSPATCSEGWFRRKWHPNLCLWTGVLVGIPTLLIAELIGNLPSGHQYNDPILLAISIGTIIRGLFYFNWRYFLVTLSLPIYLGVLSWLILRFLAAREVRRVVAKSADNAAKASAVVSIFPVWVQEVDALQVLLWYGIATWLTMILASMIARQLSRM